MNVTHQFLSLGFGNAPDHNEEEEKLEVENSGYFNPSHLGFPREVLVEDIKDVVYSSESEDLEAASSPYAVSNRISGKTKGKKKRSHKKRKGKTKKAKHDRIVIIPSEDSDELVKQQEELLMQYGLSKETDVGPANNNAQNSMESQGYECGVGDIEQILSKLKEETEQNSRPMRSKRSVSSINRFERSASTFLCIDSMSGSDDGASPKKQPEETANATGSIFSQFRHQYRLRRKDLWGFRLLKALQVILAIIGGILTLSPVVGLRDPETGLIIDQESTERTEQGLILVNDVQRAIVASSHFQVICIGITRMSAFFMYPGKRRLWCLCALKFKIENTICR